MHPAAHTLLSVIQEDTNVRLPDGGGGGGGGVGAAFFPHLSLQGKWTQTCLQLGMLPPLLLLRQTLSPSKPCYEVVDTRRKEEEEEEEEEEEDDW
eukprot:764168-Hanusia_phi.AAC.2